MYVSGLVCQQSHPLWFSVRLSVCQLQRQAVVCQQSHHLWFSVCLSVCQLQRYQEMTEFYDVNFLAPPILNAPNKIFGPKLAHSSSSLIIHKWFWVPFYLNWTIHIYVLDLFWRRQGWWKLKKKKWPFKECGQNIK